jgi:Domain of unknown function (DUF1906)
VSLDRDPRLIRGVAGIAGAGPRQAPGRGARDSRHDTKAVSDMLAGRLPSMARQGSARRALSTLTALAVLVALVVTGGTGQASASSRASLRAVSYRGYTFEVPRSWPVINLASHPGTCVRFDRHAVYLGAPGRNETCPALLVGTTDSLLIQPARGDPARSSVENPVAQQITVTAQRIRITATFDGGPDEIYRILASASLPAPVIRVPDPAGVPVAGRHDPPPGARHAGPAVVGLPAGVTNDRGLGFDSCTAPSVGYMSAWRRRSPYRAVGIYIGGADRACAQANLTARWVRREAAAGWRFIPMYVGPQASFGQLRAPRRQGAAAAADAVVQARRLGFGKWTPLYDDMEAYPPRDTGAALRFLSAWTRTLHSLGYRSGVYSSSDSGIEALAHEYSNSKYAMPDVIYDALWNGRTNTSDRVFRAGEWADHQRLHQYRGNVTQTFGGDTINIDQDYLNVRLPLRGGTRQASPAVTQRDGALDVLYRGSGSRLWYIRHGPVNGWERAVDLGGRLESAPTVVNPGAGRLDVFYRGPGGGLWQVSKDRGSGWTRPRRVGAAVLGGAPAAVAASNGVIDVFWTGPANRQLWVGQFSPGTGWAAPQLLGGGLTLGPAPVESASGMLEVFWTGADHQLWYSARGLSGSWSSPARFGAAALGGDAAATAEAGGALDLLWRGSHARRLWAASYAPGRGWSQRRDLGGSVSGVPVPLADAVGRARVFFKGRGGRLWQVVHGPRSGWLAPVRMGSQRLGAALFAAVGGSPGTAQVFWSSRTGTLWSASLGSGGKWTKPRSLGVRVT